MNILLCFESSTSSPQTRREVSLANDCPTRCTYKLHLALLDLFRLDLMLLNLVLHDLVLHQPAPRKHPLSDFPLLELILLSLALQNLDLPNLSCTPSFCSSLNLTLRTHKLVEKFHLSTTAQLPARTNSALH